MKSIILIALFTLSSCCKWKNCPGETVLCIPYYNGNYRDTYPNIGEYLIIEKQNPSIRFNYRNPPGFPDPLNCRSDVPGLSLNCKQGYRFHLYGIDRQTLQRYLLDSVDLCVASDSSCLIFDADPNHPK